MEKTACRYRAGPAETGHHRARGGWVKRDPTNKILQVRTAKGPSESAVDATLVQVVSRGMSFWFLLLAIGLAGRRAAQARLPFCRGGRIAQASQGDDPGRTGGRTAESEIHDGVEGCFAASGQLQDQQAGGGTICQYDSVYAPEELVWGMGRVFEDGE